MAGKCSARTCPTARLTISPRLHPLARTVEPSTWLVLRWPQAILWRGTTWWRWKFSIAAIGAQPLSYQWYFNDIPVPGATNATLTLTNVQPAQAGTYSVVIGSAAGTATSSGAVLTVTPFVSL